MIDYNPYPQPRESTVCTWQGYLYFVYEREAIRIAKENGYKGELTNDDVLHDYRFTNIRRRHDRLSQWVIEYMIEPAADDGDEHLWFTLLIARLVNWPPTLQALLNAHVIPCNPKDFDAERFVQVIESCKGLGKVFGAAYMLYPGRQGYDNKSEFVAKKILSDAVSKADYIHAELWENPYGIEKAVNALSKCYGINTFMAGQVAADLSYTPRQLGNAPDLYSYAPLGPGSQAGLNLLFGHKTHHSWSQEEFNCTLMQANTKVREELDITDLTLHDIQNTMCEYSKYAKAVLKLARPRRLYSPETAY